MKVTQLDNHNTTNQLKVIYSKEDLEKEYDAYICLKIIDSLMKVGLITAEEKKKLTIKIVDQFTPYLSQIVAQMT